jgi:hypothetical protein
MAGFIHNLNTPLMGLSGRIELMEIKYPDLKGFDQLTKHVDTINYMLQSTAYFTDKDTNCKEYDTDIAEFINKFDTFYKSNIKYKHSIFTEKETTEAHIRINAQKLFNSLYLIVDYLLKISEQDDTLLYTNTEKSLSLKLSRAEESGFNIDSSVVLNEIEVAVSTLKEINTELSVNILDSDLEIILNF